MYGVTRWKVMEQEVGKSAPSHWSWKVVLPTSQYANTHSTGLVIILGPGHWHDNDKAKKNTKEHS